MIQTVLEFNQELWSRSGHTVDVQMDEGLCLALVHEWCTTCAKRRYSDLDLFFSRNMPGMNRLFSFQRGFNLVSDSLNRGAGYLNFFQNDEGLTTNMITRDGRRSGVTVTRVLHSANPALIANQLNYPPNGATFMVGFWGVENGNNWGHVVGIAFPFTKSHAYYFDPNGGLSKEANLAQLGTNVIQEIDDEYDLGDINDFVVYRYMKS
jgi:hypothetical protein